MQQISFYEAPQERSFLREYYPFSQLGLLLIVVLVVLYTLALVDHNRLKLQLDELQQQGQQEFAQLERLKAELSLINVSSKLQLRLNELQEKQLAKQSMMRGFDLLEPGNFLGFSAYLEGLARHRVAGLWLTKISFERGGEFVGLQGLSGKPEQLPRLLQNLALEPVYQGSKFNVLELKSSDQADGLLFFDLRAEQVVR